MRFFQRLLTAACATILLVPLLDVSLAWFFPASNIRLVALSVLIFLCAIIVLLRAEFQLFFQNFKHPILCSYVAVFGFLAVRSFLSGGITDVGASWWGNWIRTDGVWTWIVWGMLVAVMAGLFKQSEGSRKTVLWVFGSGLLLSSIVAWFFPELAASSVGNGIRFAGFASNPWYFAQLLIFLPWVTVELCAGHRFSGRVALVVTALTGYFLFVGGVRGALVAAAVALIFVGARVSRRIAVPIIIILALVVCTTLLVKFNSRYDRIMTDPSIKTRLTLWQHALTDLHAQPIIGFGFARREAVLQSAGTDAEKILYSNKSIDTAHSGYIDILLDGGIIGLALFGLWIFYFMRSANGSSKDILIITARQATLIAYFLAAGTEFFTVWGSLPLALLAAVIIAGTEKYSPTKIPNNRTAQLGARAAALFICVLVGTSAFFVLRVVPQQAAALASAENAAATRDIVMFDQASAALTGAFPFWIERDAQFVRLATILMESGPQPDVVEHIMSLAAPRFDALVARTDLLARDDAALALFAESRALAQHGQLAQTDLQLAEELTHRALKKSPDYPAYIFNLADILREEGRGDEALALLDAYASAHLEIPKAAELARLMHEILKK